ncbi:unknown [Choristoneura occidentalis granulovirus]|uniref:Ac75-like protein n=1 Tax=Choristoneura occidentalis granulovirus TaxID=364745 RepID=Q1A4K7_9BBAC|nr:unknown [Choristoneura fumiferana granulovirus]ABC61223.1 unknown [Choristoneura fumiferana granulovirus]
MNFDFLKDLVSLNPIKTTYISNNLRSNFNFILDDHIKDKDTNPNQVTLLEKLHKIFKLFLIDELDKQLVYRLFGNKLQLTELQFYYLYKKLKQDVYVNDLLIKLIKIIDNNSYYPDTLKQQIMNSVDNEDGFTNLASFLIRECNNAAKLK